MYLKCSACNDDNFKEFFVEEELQMIGHAFGFDLRSMLAHRLNYEVNLSLCHSVAENVKVATKINKRLFLLFVEDACTSKILEDDFSMHWEEFVYNYQEQEPQ